MAALSTQNSFRNAAAGVMAAMALTTMPFAAANDAQAQQPQKVSAAPSVNVPMRDIRHSSGITDEKGREAVITMAAMASKDGQVLVLYGGNEKVWDSMIRAAQQAKAENLPVKGVILASPMPEKIVNGYYIGSPDRIQMFADGRLTSSIDSPGPNVGELVLKNLREDYTDVIIPRRHTREQLAAAPIARP